MLFKRCPPQLWARQLFPSSPSSQNLPGTAALQFLVKDQLLGPLVPDLQSSPYLEKLQRASLHTGSLCGCQLFLQTHFFFPRKTSTVYVSYWGITVIASFKYLIKFHIMCPPGLLWSALCFICAMVLFIIVLCGSILTTFSLFIFFVGALVWYQHLICFISSKIFLWKPYIMQSSHFRQTHNILELVQI